MALMDSLKHKDNSMNYKVVITLDVSAESSGEAYQKALNDLYDSMREDKTEFFSL